MHNIPTELSASRSTRYIDIVSRVGKAKNSLNINPSEKMFTMIQLSEKSTLNIIISLLASFPLFFCGRCSSFPVKVCCLFVVEAIIGPQCSGLGVRPTGAAKSRKGKNRNEKTNG